MSSINYTPYTEITESLINTKNGFKQFLNVDNIELFHLNEELTSRIGNSNCLLARVSKDSKYLDLVFNKDIVELPIAEISGDMKEVFVNLSANLHSTNSDEIYPVYYYNHIEGKIESFWSGSLLVPSEIGLDSLVATILEIEQIEKVEIREMNSDEMSVTCFIVGNDPDINFILPKSLKDDIEFHGTIVDNVKNVLIKYNR
jgi:hypothetical protein